MNQNLKLNTLIELTKKTLKEIGENPSREGLLKTPERHAKALKFLTSGYDQDAKAILKKAIFHEKY